MKTLKLTLVFSIFAATLLAIFACLGVISTEIALNSGGKVLGCVLILGISTTLVSQVMNRKSHPASELKLEDKTKNQGPQF